MPSVDPADAVAPALFGGPAATMFTVTHGAGNSLLTIIKGTLALRTSRASPRPVAAGVRQHQP